MKAGTEKEIHLAHCDAGANGAKQLADALKGRKSITSVRLYNNNIGDAGAQSIADALKINTSIISMSLSNNNIGDDGAQSIADAVKINTSITMMDLSNNNGLQWPVFFVLHHWFSPFNPLDFSTKKPIWMIDYSPAISDFAILF